MTPPVNPSTDAPVDDSGPSVAAWSKRWLACPLVVLAAACWLMLSTGQPAGAATATTTVTATVLSSVSIGNACGASGWNIGAVTPGIPATTSTVAGSCRFTFGSSNDTAMLRMYQRDQDGAAMVSRGDTSSTSQYGTNRGRNYSVSVVPGTPSNAWTVGGSKLYHTVNSGGAWASQTIGAVTSAQAVFARSTTLAYLGGDQGALRRTTNGGVTAWTDDCTVACPMAANQVIYGISGSTDADVWAVGTGGFIMHSVDANAATAHWAAQASGVGTTITSVVALTTLVAYAAGVNGVILETVNGGASWFALTGTNPSTTYYSIDAVQSGGSDYILATTDAGQVLRGVRTTGDATPGATAWTSLVADPTSMDTLKSISVLTKDDVMAVGLDGRAWRTTNASAATPTWLDMGIPDGSDWLAIDRAPTGETYVVGPADIVEYSATGAGAWTKSTEIAPEMPTWNAIRMVDRRNGWTVGSTIGGQGQIVHTTDGTTWTSQVSNAPAMLHGVVGWSTTTAVAVGDNGVIVRTTDGGTTWTPVASGVTDHLFAVTSWVDLAGARRAIAVGASGRILSSSDAGATWSASTTGTCPLASVSAAPDGSVLIAGCHYSSTGIRSVDGGATWQSIPGPSATIRTVTMADATTAFSVSGGNLYRSTNIANVNPATVTWSAVAAGGGIIAVDAYDATHISVVANCGTLRRSTDGTTFTTAAAVGTCSDYYGVAQVDAVSTWAVGQTGRITRPDSPNSLSDYGAGADWSSGAATTTFGVCVQSIDTLTTTAVWPVDTGNSPGLCEPLAGDAWQAIPTAASKVAKTTVAGNTGRVDLVWGMRAATTTAAGNYHATVTLEALAPDV